MNGKPPPPFITKKQTHTHCLNINQKAHYNDILLKTVGEKVYRRRSQTNTIGRRHNNHQHHESRKAIDGQQ